MEQMNPILHPHMSNSLKVLALGSSQSGENLYKVVTVVPQPCLAIGRIDWRGFFLINLSITIACTSE